MAAHDSLVAMFPHVEHGVIDAILESSGNDVEQAVEVLLAMSDGDGGPAGESSSSGGGADQAMVPNEAASEQQIEDDEALARQLQQQLIWEQDLLEAQQQQQPQQQQQQQQQAYGVHYGGPPVGWGGLPGAAQPPPQEAEGTIGESLSSLGSAVYSAGAATASAATDLVSGLWSWATDTGEPAPAAGDSARRHGEARGESPPPIELREVSRPAADETEVIDRGDADRGESGVAGAVRRRGAGATGTPRGMD